MYFSQPKFQPVPELSGLLDQLCCLSESELSHYPNLAGNELLIHNGKDEPQEHVAMGKKQEGLTARKQFAKDFTVLAMPYQDPEQFSSFFCQMTLHLPKSANLFPLYTEVSRAILDIKNWSADTDSLILVSVRYGSALLAPNLSVVSYSKKERQNSKTMQKEDSDSFAKILIPYQEAWS